MYKNNNKYLNNIFCDTSINSIVINNVIINKPYDLSNNSFIKFNKYKKYNEKLNSSINVQKNNIDSNNFVDIKFDDIDIKDLKKNNVLNSSSVNYSFCNNCGKQGHLFHQCKYPITSNGIILFRIKHNKLEYLMVCRKNSLGFVDLMCGKYPLYNKTYLTNIINEMTLYEKEIVLKNTFEELWKILWGKSLNSNHRFEEKIAKDKFNSLKNGISFNNNYYSLELLINESDTCWDAPEWGFPKGRRNNMEKDLTCALREFEEETGYNKKNVHIIQNIIPYEEIFTGSNYKSYKHKYYIGYLDDKIDDKIPQYQYCEISDMNWFTYEEAMDIIRPYNLEKKIILEKINNLLSEYRLYK